MASTILMCDPCSRHNKSSNGIKYCTDCEDSLCTECTSMHCAVQRISLHHLVDVSVIAGNAFNIKKNCIEHEDLSNEFYCSDHNCLVCQICIDNNHRNCGKIQTIDIPAKGCRSSLMLEDVTKDIASLLKSTKELVEESQKNKTRVGQIKAKVLKEIAKFRHDINDHIDQLERKLFSEVDIIDKKICKKVGNALCEANERQNFVENVWQQVDFYTKHGSESQLFILLNTLKSDISRQAQGLQNLIPCLESNNISFEPSDMIAVIKSLGSVKEISTPSAVTSKHYGQVQAPIEDNRQKMSTQFGFEKKVNIPSGRITGMAITNDNRLILCNDITDENNISAWTETGQHLQSLTIPDRRVFAIAIIPGTDEAMITLPGDGLIQFININSFTEGKEIQLSVVSPHGIAVIRDNLIVGSKDGKVSFIDRTSGKCQKILKVCKGVLTALVPDVGDQEDERLYCCEHNGGNAVICLILDGTRIFSCVMKEPVALALDSKGYAYVTEYNCHNLHRLSSNGEVDDILLKETDGLHCPLAVVFNKTYSKMYISNFWIY
ncbi:E3 ubiquitin-protein ligase TRIM71-like [Mytilus californianus]|uniref:E3 ubiquitin-protein ligase TRIM71-like n=1 Tax=Mytilus californianus TaxID=6549 RepID=UPI002247813A|nr:E3 ubiquitin-protein ligase TRIM71-like [Mytilus californianus]